MARKSKPELVKKLTSLWNNYYVKESYLKSVHILEDSKPLRGIVNSSLNFNFPVTVITGKNGSGKTTFLALSVLAFHANKKPIYFQGKNDYYDFNYFFPTTFKDRHEQGIKIQYEYFNRKPLNVTKGKDRWMRYIKNDKTPQRPTKGTEFLGISRIVPSFEKKNFKNYFSKSKNKSIQENLHAEKIRVYMAEVIGKPYKILSDITSTSNSAAHTLHGYDNVHTSFNAGAGEECILAIIKTLLNTDNHSIVVIEEIEIGLHPSSVSKIIDIILEIALDKKLQIIISSHSSEFLRSCPKESLVFLQRNENKVQCFPQPNIEYAISAIGGMHSFTNFILCEDVVAEKILSKILPYKILKISAFVGYGGESELITKAKIIKEANRELNIIGNLIIVWDGDSSDKYITEAEENSLIGLKLPSTDTPERYLLNKLNTEVGKKYLKSKYRLEDGDIEDIIHCLLVQRDHHDIPYELAQKLSISKEDAVNLMVDIVQQDFLDEFEGIINFMEEL